jgi:hypothetical protein
MELFEVYTDEGSILVTADNQILWADSWTNDCPEDLIVRKDVATLVHALGGSIVPHPAMKD